MTCCPECGAPNDAAICVDHFPTLLAWEDNLVDVHHLLALRCHLQHPHLYSAHMLADAHRSGNEFVLTPAAAPAP